MLYLFYGTNTNKVADQANKFVSAHKKANPDTQVFIFEGGIMESAALDELIEARGLFVDRHLVVLKQSLELAASRDIVLERVPALASSNNTFVLSEGKIEAPHRKIFEKHAKKMEEHAEEVNKEAFAGFAVGDALAERDRRKLWTEYTVARRNRVAPEALHGTLSWAARCMILASKYPKASESGLSPYVYNKFRKSQKKYSQNEMTDLSRRLVIMYHEARRGVYDLDLAIERFTLSV